MIRMAAFVRVSQNYVWLNFPNQVEEYSGQSHEVQSSFLIREFKPPLHAPFQPSQAQRRLGFASPCRGVRRDGIETVSECITSISGGAIRHINDILDVPSG